MYKITIIGLGVDGFDLSLHALNLIKNHKNVIARTGETESFKALNLEVKDVLTLDDIYLKSRNFDTLNKNLASYVIDVAKQKEVCYLVDGCATEDKSVQIILKRVKNVEVIAGVSATSKCLERLKISSGKITSIPSYEVGESYSISLPLVIYAIDSNVLASKVKLFLTELFGDEATAYVTANDFTKKIKLYELDRLKKYDYSTCLYIPEIELTKKHKFDFNDLMSILEILRSPNGCPWDREQTEKSILSNVIEEAHELVDAVLKEDDNMIVEEIGDLLLQSAFYVMFGEEEYRYNRVEVLSEVCSKLIARHTHVFGSDSASKGEDALNVWNNNKITEKGYETATDYLKAVPSSMPSIMRAQKVGKRAGKYNFDFESFNGALEKVYEEASELKQAVETKDQLDIEKECGDLLFSAVNAVRHLGVDGELALKKATEKFIKRFNLVENEVKAQNKDITKLTATELDKIYNKVKNNAN